MRGILVILDKMQFSRKLLLISISLCSFSCLNDGNTDGVDHGSVATNSIQEDTSDTVFLFVMAPHGDQIVHIDDFQFRRLSKTMVIPVSKVDSSHVINMDTVVHYYYAGITDQDFKSTFRNVTAGIDSLINNNITEVHQDAFDVNVRGAIILLGNNREFDTIFIDNRGKWLYSGLHFDSDSLTLLVNNQLPSNFLGEF
jgi:hypothetical protein